MRRTFTMLSPKYLQTFQTKFNQMLNTNQEEKIRKLFHIDGKTQKGNTGNHQKPNHIVSAVNEKGFSIGEEIVDDKSNEITAIPELLDHLNLKNAIVTIDAMGTQKDIVAKICKKKADYVLTLKGNQGKLYEETSLFFDDPKVLAKCRYHKTVERSWGCLEVREYWQSTNVGWLPMKTDWVGLRSVAMVCRTVTKSDGEVVVVQCRYFISSLKLDVAVIARVIRSHWMVEAMHWHLDVMFGEDACRVLDKVAAFNLNILRKLVLNMLRVLDVNCKCATSLVKKRFVVGCDPVRYLAQILTL
ncbi:MAG: ISAs1 family transposase [Nitrososphaerota archaeon]|nr:ISAs1 family transposase [Nitrososphaerota archaeon]